METVDNRSGTKPREKRGCGKGCFTLAASAVLIPTLFIWLVSPGITYIGYRPSGEKYSRTEFEFRYGHATRFVDDPGNHMQWVYGQLPDSITVENGVRKVVYIEPKAIVKSWSDSMDVQDGTLKHKGYMGIWSTGTHFSVDSNGEIQESQ